MYRYTLIFTSVKYWLNQYFYFYQCIITQLSILLLNFTRWIPMFSAALIAMQGVNLQMRPLTLSRCRCGRCFRCGQITNDCGDGNLRRSHKVPRRGSISHSALSLQITFLIEVQQRVYKPNPQPSVSGQRVGQGHLCVSLWRDVASSCCGTRARSLFKGLELWAIFVWSRLGLDLGSAGSSGRYSASTVSRPRPYLYLTKFLCFCFFFRTLIFKTIFFDIHSVGLNLENVLVSLIAVLTLQ